MLFTALLSSIVLSVALGTANIAFKQILFSTGAEETTKAFYSADIGAECALFLDKSGSSNFISGSQGEGSGISSGLVVNCAENFSSLSREVPNETTQISYFSIDRLGFQKEGCADITVTKDLSGFPVQSTIVSTGYNKGVVSGDKCDPDEISVERQIELVY